MTALAQVDPGPLRDVWWDVLVTWILPLLLLFGVAALVGVLQAVWTGWREKRVLKAWARRHDLTILAQEPGVPEAWDDCGTHKDDDRLYLHLTVRDPFGRTRRCLIRLGRPSWGAAFSNRIEEIWDEAGWDKA